MKRDRRGHRSPSRQLLLQRLQPEVLQLLALAHDVDAARVPGHRHAGLVLVPEILFIMSKIFLHFVSDSVLLFVEILVEQHSELGLCLLNLTILRQLQQIRAEKQHRTQQHVLKWVLKIFYYNKNI